MCNGLLSPTNYDENNEETSRDAHKARCPLNYTAHNAERRVTSRPSAPGCSQPASDRQLRLQRGGRQRGAASSPSCVDARRLDGEDLRLPVQAAADRRQRRREDLPALPLQRGLLQHHLHLHDRHRLQDPDHRAGREESQTPDLGHGGAGEVPHHHHCVLQRSHGNHAGLRHLQREVLREHQELDQEHRGARLVRRGEDGPGQQVRHDGQETGVQRPGGEAGHRLRSQVPGNQCQVQSERGGGFLYDGTRHLTQSELQDDRQQQRRIGQSREDHREEVQADQVLQVLAALSRVPERSWPDFASPPRWRWWAGPRRQPKLAG